MIRDIFTYFTGTHKVSVTADHKEKAVQLMYKHELFCNHAKLSKNGDYTFTVTHFTFIRLTEAFTKNEIEYSCSEIRGLPKTLKFIIRRPGILIGCFFFLAFMLVTSRTICSIQITGNSTVPDEEIVAILVELGCGYGDYIPNIDFDMLHARFIANSENISWIAVNMKGNHANVEVLEVKKGDETQKENGVYANIVAREEAQIAIIKTASGVPIVAEGDTVKKANY